MRKLLIKGGMAVLESGVFARDILVEGDTIAKMANIWRTRMPKSSTRAVCIFSPD